ncbi:MAG: hypothetical protein QM811_16015 [Pirellulales bacterium]
MAPALEDKDPAMQLLAMQSMQAVSGRDLGLDVNKWREYAADPTKPQQDQSLADRILKSWF